MGLVLTVVLLILNLTGETSIPYLVVFILLVIALGFHAFAIVAIGWTHNTKKRGKKK